MKKEESQELLLKMSVAQVWKYFFLFILNSSGIPIAILPTSWMDAWLTVAAFGCNPAT